MERVAKVLGQNVSAKLPCFCHTKRTDVYLQPWASGAALILVSFFNQTEVVLLSYLMFPPRSLLPFKRQFSVVLELRRRHLTNLLQLYILLCVSVFCLIFKALLCATKPRSWVFQWLSCAARWWPLASCGSVRQMRCPLPRCC